MDPITTAILAALAAGAKNVGERALSDAYSVLKDVITRRFGRNSDLDRAVREVEARPEASDRRKALQQAVSRVKADRDFTLYDAAQAVLDEIEARPDGPWIIQEVRSGRDTIFQGKGVVGPHGRYYEGPYYEGDRYYGVDPDSNLPQTAVGWIFGIVAIVCILAGLGMFGYSVLTAFEDQGTLEEGFPPGIVRGMGLFFTGFVIGIIGTLIDHGLGSRRKR